MTPFFVFLVVSFFIVVRVPLFSFFFFGFFSFFVFLFRVWCFLCLFVVSSSLFFFFFFLSGEASGKSDGAPEVEPGNCRGIAPLPRRVKPGNCRG